MLRDLTVKNYRCFEDFQIDGLERVNLFVGNNNSGKTSLLEAIYLLVNPQKIHSLFCIFQDRNYFENSIDKSNLMNIFLTQESIKHFFYKHNISSNYNIKIKSKLTIPVEIPQLLEPSEHREYIFLSISPRVFGNYEQIDVDFKFFDPYNKKERQEKFLIYNNENENSTSSDFLEQVDIQLINSYSTNTNYKFVSQKKQNVASLKNIWKAVYLTEKENKVEQALQIIEPNIQRIGFAIDENYNIIQLKVNGHSEPIPLSIMGEGMHRILALAMSLVTSENGVLLVDEIETGLHYEAQTDMWRLILETAKELNVQVFATTHSWDCIAAFQEALSQVEDQSIGKLFRLDSKYGKLRAVEYNAEDLEIATREGIEVR